MMIARDGRSRPPNKPAQRAASPLSREKRRDDTKSDPSAQRNIQVGICSHFSQYVIPLVGLLVFTARRRSAPPFGQSAFRASRSALLDLQPLVPSPSRSGRARR